LHKKFRLVAVTGVESKWQENIKRAGFNGNFSRFKKKKAPQLALKGFCTRNGTNVEPSADRFEKLSDIII
jgi:hypothetical protein